MTAGRRSLFGRLWIAGTAATISMLAGGAIGAYSLAPDEIAFRYSLAPLDDARFVLDLRSDRVPLTVLISNSSDRVVRLLDEMSYDLDDVRTGRRQVPRVFLTSLPADLGDDLNIRRRKDTFVRVMLPLALKVNEELRADRDRLVRVVEAIRDGGRVTPEDHDWLDALADRYKVRSGQVDALLRRVDAVPPSLILAQAIEESGWGTSRFAREGNALFGQYTFSDSTPGLVPEDRKDGASHRIRAFDSLLEAVRSYAYNLNTHRAYRKFRSLRAGIRDDGGLPTGRELASTLLSYSERGADYVSTLHLLMSADRLSDLDEALLAPVADDIHLVHLMTATGGQGG